MTATPDAPERRLGLLTYLDSLPTRMSEAEFVQVMDLRFGPDPQNWLYLCPRCLGTASPADFALRFGMSVPESRASARAQCPNEACGYDPTQDRTGARIALRLADGSVRQTMPCAPSPADTEGVMQ